jgi:hypothetical protein
VGVGFYWIASLSFHQRICKAFREPVACNAKGRSDELCKELDPVRKKVTAAKEISMEQTDRIFPL